MEEPQQQASLGELMDEILAMPEYKLRQQLLSFNTSIYILDQNFAELQMLIDFLVNNPEGHLLTAASNQDRLRQVQIDIIRRLHNFVAAAQSLVDHTRRFYDKLYGSSNLFPDYQAQVNQVFVTDPLSQFVQRLRQYCQHYKAPDIGIEVSVTQSEDGFIETRTIFLPLEDLKDFDGWNAAAKKYMNGLMGNVDVLEVATNYRNKVMDFYRWFQSRQQEIHAAELARFESKQTEFALVHLEWMVNACLNNKDDMPYRAEEIFYGILPAQELEALTQLPAGSSERMTRAIELFERQYPLPDGLRRKIELLYQDPGFWEPRL